eukprot:scaffold96074_cov29-Prasinocladus_malaysianus.AAC.1
MAVLGCTGTLCSFGQRGDFVGVGVSEACSLAVMQIETATARCQVPEDQGTATRSPSQCPHTRCRLPQWDCKSIRAYPA